jgi:hypothetical protein
MGTALEHVDAVELSGTERYRTTRLILPRLALFVTVSLLAAMIGRSASASAASCSGSACTGQDPYATACNVGDSIAGSAAIVDGAGATIGELKLYWSAQCQTNWGQAYFNDGNPASTPPVTVSVEGSSSSATYDSGSVPFTYTGSGSPVWGNMVYSPGCAYATVTRGDASATAVQIGCPPPGGGSGPITLMLQPPPTKCVGSTCTGQDPYESACSTGASVVGSGPITEGASPIGTLYLYSSPACATSWGQASFNDGNPPSTPPVDVSAVGTDPSASTPYDTHPVEFVTTGSGSPVWGNMVPSSSCSYAIVKRGRASGMAVQSGCPTPGHGSTSAGGGVLTASGESIQVIGGEGLPGPVAHFTDSDTTVGASYFTVTINWGDGSGESTGQVVGLNGQFAVNGSHRYPDPTEPGRANAQGWNVTVTIVAADGTTATAYTSVEVIGRDIPVTTPSDNSPPAMSSGDKPVNVGLGIFGTIVSGIGCGAGIFGELPSLGSDTALTGLACAGTAGSLASTGVAVHDPPDRRFRRVFRAREPRLPGAPMRCGHIRHSVCVSVHAALVLYLRSYVRAETLLEDVGVTADRFGGAAAARNREGERLQRDAEHRYFSRWVAAVHAREAAGRKLGVLLQLHGLDRRISAAQVNAGRKRLLRLAEVSPAELATLRGLGVAGSAAQVIEDAKQQLSWAPPAGDTSLAAVLAR